MHSQPIHSTDGSTGPQDAEAGARLVSLRGVSKRFGDFQALRSVDFELRAGEVHCLLGENGAGKSTLMSILFGLQQADSGEILLRDRATRLRSPRDAIDARIGMVHQQFMLAAPLTVAENILLGEAGGFESVRKGAGRIRLKALADQYGFDIGLDREVGTLSLGERQQVEIMKLLFRNSNVLILDEPTSVLTPAEVENLFATLSRLVRAGMGVILITHKMHEVMAFADRVTVLRQGRVMGTALASRTSKAELTSWMFGRSGDEARPAARAVAEGPARLVLSGVSASGDNGLAALSGIDLAVSAGEILGVAGVSGNGQRELAEVIAGVRPPSAGSIELAGKRISGSDPRRIRECGLAYIPEERAAGLAVGMSIAENLAISDYHAPPLSRFGLLRPRAVEAFATRGAHDLKLPLDRLTLDIRTLSGGNQQRVVLARALAHKPTCVVAAQATIGLDLATCAFVHETLRGVAAEGGCVVYISTDLDELLAIADRIAVLFEGRLVDIVGRSEFDRNAIGFLMAGGGGAR